MELNNMTSLRGMLEQMPTEKLDEMLHEELRNEPADDNAIRMIMSVLRERDKDKPVEITLKIEKAWEKYQHDIAKLDRQESRSQQVRSWLLKAAVTAAVLALVLVPIVPQEAGAESLWGALVRLTTDIVEFFGPDDNKGRLAEYEFRTDNPGLQQLHDAVVELGVTDPYVPMWLPVVCETIDIKTVSTPARSGITASFPYEDGEIVYKMAIYATEVSHKYQKDEIAVEKHEIYDTTFNIMRNNEMWVVIWAKDNIECSIFVDCQEEVLYRILESIYVMEDQ